MEGIDKAIELGYNPVKVFYHVFHTFLCYNFMFSTITRHWAVYPVDIYVGQLCGHARPQWGRAAGFRGADGKEAAGGALHRVHAFWRWVLMSGCRVTQVRRRTWRGMRWSYVLSVSATLAVELFMSRQMLWSMAGLTPRTASSPCLQETSGTLRRWWVTRRCWTASSSSGPT